MSKITDWLKGHLTSKKGWYIIVAVPLVAFFVLPAILQDVVGIAAHGAVAHTVNALYGIILGGCALYVALQFPACQLRAKGDDTTAAIAKAIYAGLVTIGVLVAMAHFGSPLG